MKRINVKDEEIEVSEDYYALIVAIQELTHAIKMKEKK